MEGNSSWNIFSVGKSPAEELAELQEEHDKKTSRIQELKGQLESTKTRLETKKKGNSEDKMKACKALCDKYNIVREEYNGLLAQEFGKSDN